MSGITITPIPNKVFGATVTGVALRDISDADFATLKAAFLKHGFLVFPNQFLTDAENIAFGLRFGELEFGAAREKDPSWFIGDGGLKELWEGDKRVILVINSEQMEKISALLDPRLSSIAVRMEKRTILVNRP